MSPADVRAVRFGQAKRGYEQTQVDAFVAQVADALESAQNDTTAMEARARAAVARLQELTQAGGAAAGADAGREITPDEAETISRTLLLAQRTADATIAEARAEADRVLAAARDEAAASLDQAREQTAAMLEEARAEARRAGESERVQAESEVQSLLARRDFLESDVDHLEQFLVTQRERIGAAAAALADIVERVPGGLGELRKPLLSAAGAPADDDGADRTPVGVEAEPAAADDEQTPDTLDAPDADSGGGEDATGADEADLGAPGPAGPATAQLPLTGREP